MKSIITCSFILLQLAASAQDSTYHKIKSEIILDGLDNLMESNHLIFDSSKVLIRADLTYMKSEFHFGTLSSYISYGDTVVDSATFNRIKLNFADKIAESKVLLEFFDSGKSLFRGSIDQTDDFLKPFGHDKDFNSLYIEIRKPIEGWEHLDIYIKGKQRSKLYGTDFPELITDNYAIVFLPVYLSHETIHQRYHSLYLLMYQVKFDSNLSFTWKREQVTKLY